LGTRPQVATKMLGTDGVSARQLRHWPNGPGMASPVVPAFTCTRMNFTYNAKQDRISRPVRPTGVSSG